MPTPTVRRLRIRLKGIVQGVGFRPFVHHLATRFALGGWVLNSSAGLCAEIEGEPPALEGFLAALSNEAPPLAWIQEMATEEVPAAGGGTFEIRPSMAETGEFALVSADAATCPDCLREIADPSDRRFGYPFTNCTNCGPRYTIIRDIPYDRPNTTMAAFRMCAACQAEYGDPGNRRFHAQPNACPECGPSLSGTLAEVRGWLAAGEIVAIKGLGGFHLACDPRNPQAVERLRQRKRRSDKPFALMARDLEAVEQLCMVTEADRRALLGPARPIVILPRREPGALPEELAPGNRTLGVMLPYTPLHHLLFAGAPYSTLVMTSGNFSEEPIVTSNREGRERLGAIADRLVVHDREIYMRADDSVVRVFEDREIVLRRSRGYVPQTIDLGRKLPELLACGGELKNAFCLTKGSHAILSQHIGDMENYETLLFFEETLANLKNLFRVTPCGVVHDLHPQYLSTQYALRVPELPKIGVQHHHAHVAACMAENGLEGEAIGVAFDGTGYGTDGAIWGGEFLVAGYAGFERRAHLRYIRLAGGDAAIREPWRPALAYLMDAMGESAQIAGIAESRARVVRRMIETGVHTVLTSSCGRLFDAVAAIAGVRREVNFEAQAAMELETIAEPGVRDRYPFEIQSGTSLELDFRPAVERIAREAASGVSPAVISARFHNTVAEATAETCRRIGVETKLKRVCLSGGTFQNMRLLGETVRLLRSSGFEVFLHHRVPPNDGGLALGQAAVAQALWPS